MCRHFNPDSLIGLILFFILVYPQMLLSFPDKFNEQSLTPEKLIKNLRTQNFSGEKIDFVFSNTNILEMLLHLEKVSGMDFDVDPKIKTYATYHLKDVPWDEALSILLRDNDLNIDTRYNHIKIFQGQKYEVVFTEPNKARIVIFLYSHFSKFLLGLLFGVMLFTGFRIYRKLNPVQKAHLKKLLDPESADEIQKRLQFLLGVEKIYRDENLSLLALSEKLNITPHQLSWVINDKMNQSFSTLINRYRIEDVKKRLAEGTKINSTILQMAFDSGFSTKTAFNRAFKKFTGLTPTQYRKNNNH